MVYIIGYLMIGLVLILRAEWNLRQLHKSDDPEKRAAAELIRENPVIIGIMHTLLIVSWPLMLLTKIMMSLSGWTPKDL